MKITKGKQQSAIRFVIYGAEGIGKSTLASQMPEPLFLDLEGGTKQIDTSRAEVGDYSELISALDELIQDAQGFKTIVIDTADRMEVLATLHVCEANSKKSIEDFGYGKGYTVLAECIQQELLKKFDKLIVQGINVVITAHAIQRKVEDPENPPYDHWELKCSKKVSPLLKEWADVLLFCNYNTTILSENGKNKAVGKGKRMMFSSHRPQYDAKSRYELPAEMELSIEPLKSIFGSKPQKVADTLDVTHQNNGIVEDDMHEDARDVLVRRLEANYSIKKEEFEQWLKATGRIAENDTLMALSNVIVYSMLTDLETLASQIKK